MNNNFLKAGAFIAALAVIFGAFAAHAIKSRVTADVLAIFETGVRYQMYHAFGLLLTGILYKEFPYRSMKWAGNLFLVGVVIFSGSLYLLTYFKACGNDNMLWLGAVTPFGGAAFIIGWGFVFKSFFSKKPNL